MSCKICFKYFILSLFFVYKQKFNVDFLKNQAFVKSQFFFIFNTKLNITGVNFKFINSFKFE